MANIFRELPDALVMAGIIAAGMVVLTLAGMLLEGTWLSPVRRRKKRHPSSPA